MSRLHCAASTPPLLFPDINGVHVGTPAYPDPTHDPSHQLPLTNTVLGQIVSGIMPTTTGAFMWVASAALEVLTPWE